MTVLLLKQASVEDRLLLEKHAIPAHFLPVFEYYPCVDPAALSKQLKKKHTGWIFTSKRAVETVAPYLMKPSEIRPILTVGKRSADHLGQVGWQVTGMYEEVKSLLPGLSSFPVEEWIYFCGALHRPEIRSYCLANQISLHEEVVYNYRSLTVELPPGEVSSIWAFSSATLQAFQSHLGSDLLNKPIFCIGPSTATTARALHFREVHTSPHPDLSSLVKVYHQFKIA